MLVLPVQVAGATLSPIVRAAPRSHKNRAAVGRRIPCGTPTMFIHERRPRSLQILNIFHWVTRRRILIELALLMAEEKARKVRRKGEEGRKEKMQERYDLITRTRERVFLVLKQGGAKMKPTLAVVWPKRLWLPNGTCSGVVGCYCENFDGRRIHAKYSSDTEGRKYGGRKTISRKRNRARTKEESHNGKARKREQQEGTVLNKESRVPGAVSAVPSAA